MTNRERKVDLNTLSIEQAESLSTQLGEKIKEITEKAVADANRILNIYGLEAKMQIVFGEIGKISKEKPADEPSQAPKKRRGRPRKANL